MVKFSVYLYRRVFIMKRRSWWKPQDMLLSKMENTINAFRLKKDLIWNYVCWVFITACAIWTLFTRFALSEYLVTWLTFRQVAYCRAVGSRVTSFVQAYLSEYFIVNKVCIIFGKLVLLSSPTSVENLNPYPAEARYILPLHSVDPDQLASEEAKWFWSALLAIKHVNLYQHLDQVIWLAENNKWV